MVVRSSDIRHNWKFSISIAKSTTVHVFVFIMSEREHHGRKSPVLTTMIWRHRWGDPVGRHQHLWCQENSPRYHILVLAQYHRVTEGQTDEQTYRLICYGRPIWPLYFCPVVSLWSPYVIGQTIIFYGRPMLCNRETIYIFILFLLLSFFFFCSPNLSGRRLDVYHTLAHGVALVRI